MNTSPDLRCMMKIRTCGFFWYKAVVSLSFPTNRAHDPKHQGLLTIVRPKAFGDTLKISLDRVDNMPTCMFSSLKDERRCQFTVCYSSHRRCVTVRAPTPMVYKAWWSALETAFMTARLMNMSRALATNFDVLPELEPELERDSNFDDIGALNTRTDNVPMLQALNATSTHEDSDRESWQSSESPDELVVIRSAKTEYNTESESIDGSHAGEHTMTPSSNFAAEYDNEKATSNVKIDLDESYCSETSYLSSSDGSGSSLSSLISKDVLDCLSSDVRDLMDSYLSASSYNTSSSVVNHIPRNVYELVEDLAPDDAQKNRLNSFYPLKNGPFRHGHESHNSSDGDSNTVSTAQLTDLEDMVSTVETEETTTNVVFEPPICNTSTPFQRLLLRQQSRAATKNSWMVSNVVATPAPILHLSTEDGVLATKSHRREARTNNDSDYHQWNRGVSRNRCRLRGDTGCRGSGQPQKLVTGRINKTRVQEIEYFASQRVPDSTCTSKMPIVINQITKVWTDVARFAFRPNAATDHKVSKYRYQRIVGRYCSSPRHGNTDF